jgi:hypothetical protein
MFPSMVNHPCRPEAQKRDSKPGYRGPVKTFVNRDIEKKMLKAAEKKVADLPIDQIGRILFNLGVSPGDLDRRLKILQDNFPSLSPKRVMQKAYAAFTVNLVVSEEEI